MKEDSKAFVPIDLSPELEQEQRVKDLLLQRSLDKKWKIKFYEIVPETVLMELNLRFSQYRAQFKDSIEYTILQCIQDFNKHITPLQLIMKDSKGRNVSKVNYSLPVAQWGKKFIYANPKGDQFNIFITEKVKEL